MTDAVYANNSSSATVLMQILLPSQNKCNSKIRNLSYKECNFD
jgi:hypothetical protein